MGDFQERFLRPDSGINTVEGNVAGKPVNLPFLSPMMNVCPDITCCAGSRAAELSKKREAEQKLFEERKKKIKKDSERGKLGM